MSISRTMTRALLLPLVAAGLLQFAVTADARRSRKPPCWVTEPCEPYTGIDHLTAVGGGVGLSQSDARAQAALLHLVTAPLPQIRSSFEQLQHATHETLDQQLREPPQNTEPELRSWHKDVEIALRHEGRDRSWSLAVLSRNAAMVKLEAELVDIDNTLAEIRLEIDQASSRVDRIRALSRALPLARHRELLNGQHRVLHDEGQGHAGGESLARLVEQRRAEFDSLRLWVDPSGPAGEALTAPTEQALTAMGFKLDPMRPDLEIKLHTHETRSGTNEYGFHQLELSAELTIEEIRPGQTVVHQTRHYRSTASSRDVDRARQGARTDIATQLTERGETLTPTFAELVLATLVPIENR